jgi:hypothetical protein
MDSRISPPDYSLAPFSFVVLVVVDSLDSSDGFSLHAGVIGESNLIVECTGGVCTNCLKYMNYFEVLQYLYFDYWSTQEYGLVLLCLSTRAVVLQYNVVNHK